MWLIKLLLLVIAAAAAAAAAIGVYAFFFNLLFVSLFSVGFALFVTVHSYLFVCT